MLNGRKNPRSTTEKRLDLGQKECRTIDVPSPPGEGCRRWDKARETMGEVRLTGEHGELVHTKEKRGPGEFGRVDQIAFTSPLLLACKLDRAHTPLLKAEGNKVRRAHRAPSQKENA